MDCLWLYAVALLVGMDFVNGLLGAKMLSSDIEVGRSGSIGAEISVHKGDFSDAILYITRPKNYFLSIFGCMRKAKTMVTHCMLDKRAEIKNT